MIITGVLKKQFGMIREHFSVPFYSNAYALIALQVATSLLGLIFWFFVARTLSTNQIGLGTALYSAAMLLVWLAGLGFDDGLTYYLPHSSNPNALINSSFCVTAAAACLLAVGFIAGVSYWSPNLSFLHESLILVAAFIACVIALQFSTMQDGLFIAERLSKYALYKGIVTNFLRFPIFLFLLFSHQWVILISAAGASCLGMFIYWSIYQNRHRPNYRFSINFAPITWMHMVRFSFGNYITNLLTALPNTLLPLVVLSRLGAEANAYFYMAWLLGSMINVIGRSFGVSLFVESSRDSNSINLNVLRSLKSSSIFVIPGVIGLSVFSRPLLLLLGKNYGSQATVVMILIAISCIPFTVYSVAVGVLKARGKVRELIVAGGLSACLHIGLSVIFSNLWGLNGLGYAIILARLLSALVVLLFVVKNKLTSWGSLISMPG